MTTETCGAYHPHFPTRYFCEYPKGHGPITCPDSSAPGRDTPTYDHGAPSINAYWRAKRR